MKHLCVRWAEFILHPLTPPLPLFLWPHSYPPPFPTPHCHSPPLPCPPLTRRSSTCAVYPLKRSILDIEYSIYSYRSCLFAVSISEKTSQKAHVQYRWTCTRLPLHERIALTFKSSKTCACAQDMSRRILRQVRMRATECGCVQRCFSKWCIFRPVAARAERKVPR